MRQPCLSVSQFECGAGGAGFVGFNSFRRILHSIVIVECFGGIVIFLGGGDPVIQRAEFFMEIPDQIGGGTHAGAQFRKAFLTATGAVAKRLDQCFLLIEQYGQLAFIAAGGGQFFVGLPFIGTGEAQAQVGIV